MMTKKNGDDSVSLQALLMTKRLRMLTLTVAVGTLIIAASTATASSYKINNRRRFSAVRGQNQLLVDDVDPHRMLGVGNSGVGSGKSIISSKGRRPSKGDSRKSGSGTSKSHYEKGDEEGDDEEKDDEIPDEYEEGDEDDDSKGTKLNGGKTNGKDNSGKTSGSKKGKKGDEGDADYSGEPDTFRRTVPAIKLSYEIDGPMKRSQPGMGDYNELSLTTEYFFDSFFRSVFEDLPVSHDATIVHVMLDDDKDPFTVDFMVGLDFVVPGEVPTIPFILDWVEQAFGRQTSMDSYLSDLASMSETNPFSATKSVVIVRANPDEAIGFSEGPGGPWRDPRVENSGSDKKKVLIGLISGTCLLVFVAVGLLWIRQRRSSRRVTESDDECTLDSGSDPKERDRLKMTGSSGILKTGSSKQFSSHAQEEDTVTYLNSVRRRYKDEEDERTVKTAFESVFVPEEEKIRQVELPRCPSKDEEEADNGGSYDYEDDCDTVESYQS